MSAIAAEACLDARVSHGIVEVQDTQVIIALELRGNQCVLSYHWHDLHFPDVDVT